MKSTQHKEWTNEHRSAVANPGEDTSVAFSVDAEPTTESAAAATSPAAHVADDDRDASSGVIDLSALRAGERSAPQVLDVLPIFPFGEPPASARAPASAQGAARPAWRARQATALLAAAGAVVALTVGFVAPRAADPGPPATAGLAAATRALEARLPRAEPPAAELAERAQRAPAPSAPSAAERAVAGAPGGDPGIVVAARRAPEGRARVTGAAAPQHGKAGAAATGADDRRAPADPCGGDLMCAMRRATGG
ncbi:hypothetical protein [Sorangium sp. So ce176]|uniref:hypothetical protein n=1 Tax=Sorangium sp. So ce176 TaxID=3133286 RepID=UPI003F5D8087